MEFLTKSAIRDMAKTDVIVFLNSFISLTESEADEIVRRALSDAHFHYCELTSSQRAYYIQCSRRYINSMSKRIISDVL